MKRGFITAGSASNSAGSGIALSAVTNIYTLTASNKVYVKWTDPEDIEFSGSPLATWAGTLLVRKAGSMPTNRMDGIVILDSKERNAYQNNYFCDSGLTNGTTYYYKLFPYTTTKTYTESESNGFNATPDAVLVGNVSGISIKAGGSKKLNIQWTDPDLTVVSDGITLATWESTSVVYKTGSYPTSLEDGTLTIKSTTRNAYASIPYTINGLENGTTYYFAFFPTTTDGAVTVDNANRGIGIPELSVIKTVPSQKGTLTYNGTTNTNGSAQTPEWNDYDTSQLDLVVTAQTNAGQYQATFTPKDDFCWSDNSVTEKVVNWSIGKKNLSKPSASTTTFTYNTNSQIPAWTGCDANTMTIGGNSVAQTNAGDYSTTFIPMSNFQWSDGTVIAHSISWKINRATLPKPSVDKTNILLSTKKTSDTFNVTRLGDGVITVTSDTDAVAMATVNNTVVTVKSANNTPGTAKITIHVKQGTNYEAYTSDDVSVSVDAQFLPTRKTLDEQTWAEISQISEAGEGANYWAVGDCKGILVNGTIGTQDVNKTLYVYILGFNHKVAGNIDFGTFKTAATNGKDVCLVDDKYESNISNTGDKRFALNHWGTTSTPYNTNYGGWKGCDARYDILGSTNKAPDGYGSTPTTARKGYDADNTTTTSPVANTLMAALPSDLRAVMKPMTVYTDNTGNNSNVSENVTTSVDYLPLLAEYEIFGSRSYANRYERNYQEQYSYYANGNPEVKYMHNNNSTTVKWWTRSPSFNSPSTFAFVSAVGGSTHSGSWNSYGLAPAFRV